MSTEFENALQNIRFTATIEDAKNAYHTMSEAYKSTVDEDVFVRFFTGRDRSTILWHDYEAGGVHAKSAPPMQFAAVRTDLDLNVIDCPIDVYARLDCDKLPHPEAVAITHINPMKCMKEGLPEPEFFRRINQEMSYPDTCTTGYNSMNYDEEVTRFGLWRSLIPVYNREFENNNSRWDLLPVMAAYASLKIPGVVIPTNEEGQTTLKLEALAPANNIKQDNAHNALDDVFALVGLAKVLKRASPLLWDYLYDGRRKKAASGRCLMGTTGMLFSPMMGAKNNYGKPVLIIGNNPQNTNSGKVYVELDDMENVRSLWRMSPEQIKENLFKKGEQLEAEGIKRPPLSTLKVNESPAFIPFSWLMRHGFVKDDSPVIAGDKIGNQRDFLEKLISVFADADYPEETNPELKLYGGFPSRNDKQQLSRMSYMPLSEAFGSVKAEFEDPDLNQLYLNARARLRGYDGVQLSDEELYAWRFHCSSLHAMPVDEASKGNNFNLSNVDEVLAETEMDDALRAGYKEYLNYVRLELG